MNPITRFVLSLLFIALCVTAGMACIFGDPFRTPRITRVSDAQLRQWGYHRQGSAIVPNDDRLTVHVDGTVTDFHGDYVGRVELNTKP